MIWIFVIMVLFMIYLDIEKDKSEIPSDSLRLFHANEEIERDSDTRSFRRLKNLYMKDAPKEDLEAIDKAISIRKASNRLQESCLEAWTIYYKLESQYDPFSTANLWKTREYQKLDAIYPKWDVRC